jgi:small multidrug resistance pump
MFYALSSRPLTLALRRLELSIAYAIWTDVGTVLITLIGLMNFNEQTTFFECSLHFFDRVRRFRVIAIGVVGLKHSAGT